MESVDDLDEPLDDVDQPSDDTHHAEPSASISTVHSDLDGRLVAEAASEAGNVRQKRASTASPSDSKKRFKSDGNSTSRQNVESGEEKKILVEVEEWEDVEEWEEFASTASNEEADADKEVEGKVENQGNKKGFADKDRENRDSKFNKIGEAAKQESLAKEDVLENLLHDSAYILKMFEDVKFSADILKVGILNAVIVCGKRDTSERILNFFRRNGVKTVDRSLSTVSPEELADAFDKAESIKPSVLILSKLENASEKVAECLSCIVDKSWEERHQVLVFVCVEDIAKVHVSMRRHFSLLSLTKFPNNLQDFQSRLVLQVSPVKEGCEAYVKDDYRCMNSPYTAVCPDVDHRRSTLLVLLHVAVREGNMDVVVYMLAKHCDVNVVDEGQITALHYAAAYGRVTMVDMLINAGSHVNSSDSWGFAPLHDAARMGHTQICNRLLDSGADPKVINMDSATPLHMAKGDSVKNLLSVAMANQPSAQPRASNPVSSELQPPSSPSIPAKELNSGSQTSSTEKTLKVFLEENNLSHLLDLLKAEKISLGILQDLGHEELRAAGVLAYGDRHLIIKALEKIREKEDKNKELSEDQVKGRSDKQSPGNKSSREQAT